MTTTGKDVPNTTMGAAFQAAGVKSESPVRLVSKDGAHIAEPPPAQAPVKKAKTAAQRLKRCLDVLYGPKAGGVNKPQRQLQLRLLLELFASGELSLEQRSAVLASFADAMSFGDVDGELAVAFLGVFLETCELRCVAIDQVA